jgi:hypothetical protein
MGTISDHIIDDSSKADGDTDEEDADNKESDEEDNENDNRGNRAPCKPANSTNFALHVNRMWVDVHNVIPRTDSGLFIPGMPTDYDEDEFAIGNKDEGESMIGSERSHPGEDEDDADTPGPSKARRSSKKQHSAREGVPKGKTDAFEKRRPDLVLVDHSSQEGAPDRYFWRHFAVLLEVKRTRSDAPNPADGKSLTRLVAQLADMARLHLAARPFMRYSVHLSVCGAIFNLFIFDRAGGVVSKNYNFSTDLDTIHPYHSSIGTGSRRI